ncbi:potassium voltage-gated channel protein Shaker-like [Dendronephthya gigantea]|uniref:potassium voltage-gated channel protein Shaker-like n=1 Tax=Dendronephthya gigantea TaxID=151771 RepID=UPI00106A806C|nr:potassium voltage-gated channel protein Shaker-like [Dendronephthya gigantea]
MQAYSAIPASPFCQQKVRRYSCLRGSFHDNQNGLSNHKRVRLNVSGMIFETFESTFDRFPETLLGSYEKRTKYYDPIRDEYYFARDKNTFDAILFYYQSKGILCRPEHVPSDVFKKELKFFEINDRRFPILNKVIESKTKAKRDPSELTFRERGWELLENPESSVAAKYLSFFSIFIIALSLITYCLETVPALKPRKIDSDPTNHCDHWFIMECLWIIWFSVELILRFSFTPNRIRFLYSPFGLVDLVAVLPFYLTLFLQSDSGATSFAVLRILRVGRCLRLFKLSRYHCAPGLFAATIKDCQDKLRALALCIFITVILFSSSMYYIEGFSDDSPFKSIPDAFYYVIITMVTVGYGDYVPKTVLGRILGGFCAFSGVIVLYCFPTPIIVVRFVQLYKEYVISEMEKSGKDTKEFEKKFNDELFLARQKRLK